MNGNSFDWKTKNQALEFKILSPDEIYPFVTPPRSTAQDDRHPYLELFIHSFEKCSTWETHHTKLSSLSS